MLIRLPIALLALLLQFSIASAVVPACQPFANDGTPSAVVANLKKGFNLPGWLDQSRPRRPDPALLAELARRGFTHVRLPFEPQLLFSPFAEQFQAEMDRALDQLIGLGFTVSLDNHPGATFIGDYAQRPDEGYARLSKAWATITQRMAGRSREKVFFELWNEPPIGQALWRAHAERLIGEIRKTDPDRTILFGDAPFERFEPLISQAPLPFSNVVYVVHFYDPMVFTHQGADWMPGTTYAQVKGVPFPAGPDDPRLLELKKELTAAGHAQAVADLDDAYAEAWTPDRINEAFTFMRTWAQRHGVHVIVNEFGVLEGAAEPVSRAAWLKAVRQAAERNCIGWAHWELLDGFGFVGRDGRTIDEGVADALLDD